MLVLAAFVFRALIPVGFMPSFTSTGGASITICSEAEGMKTIALDADGQPVPSSGDRHEPCGFSVNTGGLEAAPSLAALPVFYFARLANFAVRDAFMPATPLETYPSRAPPAL